MQIRQPEKLLIFLSINEYIANVSLYAFSKPLCLNVSTTPITAMGCRQCLRLRVVQLKGKHCRKPHCPNGVVDTLGCLKALKQENFAFSLKNTRFDW